MSEEKKFLELLAQENTPTVSSDTQHSGEQLTKAEQNSLPNNYANTYGGKIDAAINNWMSGRGFEYNTSNDKDYQAFTQQYRQNAEAGSSLAKNTANALANGYVPTYADIVANEVYNKHMENVSDAVPTYREMAQLDYNAEQNRLANAANIYSQLDSTDYGRSRDEVNDYENFLNTLYNRHIADKQTDAQLDSINESIYGTQLSAAQNALQGNRNYDLVKYLYNTQSADSKAQIAQAEAENEQKIAYNNAEDAFNEYVESQKNKGKTRNAEAVFAALGVTEKDFEEDGELYDETGVKNYTVHAKAYIDGALAGNRIDTDERDYLYDKIGVTSDDETFNKEVAESFINKKKLENMSELKIMQILDEGFENGDIDAADVAYISAKYLIDFNDYEMEGVK